MKKVLVLAAFLLLLPLTAAAATTYYVSPGGSNSNAGTQAQPWQTIGKAAATLVAGDTVIVAPGSYDERVSPANSGSPGNPITYIGTAGRRPKVRGFGLANRNYITISGFEITNVGFTADNRDSISISGGTGVQILDNDIHHVNSAAIAIGNASFLRISDNQISFVGVRTFSGGGSPAFSALFGQPSRDVLIEQNRVSYVNDYLIPLGTRFVYRNNILGPSDPLNAFHIDGMQNNGIVTDSLMEGNLSIDNANSDNHLFLNQVKGSTGWIIRYNVTNRSKGGLDWRDANNHYFYNNTLLNNVDYYNNSFQVLLTNSTGNVARNNIWHRSVRTGGSPYKLEAGSQLDADYDLFFNSGIQGQNHGLTANPLLVDATIEDFRPDAGSPAIGAGGPLTTLHASDSGGGTSLVVTDAHFFQDGWAGVSPDWIAVGNAGNAVQIRAIDYSTNTLTLAEPITRSKGDPVWLYKNSSGTTVLFGAAPDIGAFPFVPGSAPATLAPVNVRAAAAAGAIQILRVRVNDAAGNPVQSVRVNFTRTAGDGTVLTARVVTGSNGQAGAAVILGATAGKNSFAATVDGTSISSTLSIVGSAGPGTHQAVSLTGPVNGETMLGTVTIFANAIDDTVVSGVQFKINGANLGPEDRVPPFSITWNTATVPDGFYTLTAVASDLDGMQSTSPVVAVVVSNAPTTTYSIPANGARSFVSSGTTEEAVRVAHARIHPNSYSPAGIAIMELRSDGILVAETSVPASPEMQSGRLYVRIAPHLNTGVALSNSTAQDAQVSFTFANADGVDVGSGVFTLAANRQLAAFLNQAPFNGPAALEGTFHFSSSVPLGALALRGLTNERGEFLITTLPVSPAGGSLGPAVAVLPHFADGGGWTTQVVLANSSEASQSGTVQFFDRGSGLAGASVVNMPVGGSLSSTFRYSIPPHGTFRLETEGVNGAVQTGSVRIVPDGGDVPDALAIFSYRYGGITTSEASISARPMGTGFRMYLESQVSGDPGGQTGSIQSGVAISNSSALPVIVRLELYKLDGSSAASAADITVPAGGQIARFIGELFPAVSGSFQGIARLTSVVPVAVAAVRVRHNERGDLLLTATPPLSDLDATSGRVMVFPHIVSSGGYSTRLILFGEAASGDLLLLPQGGTTP